MRHVMMYGHLLPLETKDLLKKFTCTYICIFAYKTKNNINAYKGSRTTYSCTAVGNYGTRVMDMPHVGNERQKLFWLCRCPMVWPTRIVQVSNLLDLFGLRKTRYINK